MASLQELLAAKKAASSMPAASTEQQKPSSDQASVASREQPAPSSIERNLTVEAADIVRKIEALAGTEEDSLKGAMDDLKTALLQNPAASALLLPEEIGAMVATLRRITKTAITAATTKKERKSSKKVLTPEELEAAYAEL